MARRTTSSKVSTVAKAKRGVKAAGPGARGEPLPFRIGHGWDLHRLEAHPPLGAGRPMIVGGVRIPDPPPGSWREGTAGPVGPVAHSDGDVLYHAVTDALLGALCLPDIGQLFPDTSKDNDGRDSADFLREAVRRVHGAGYLVGNVDTTVVLQRPKISPFKEQIRANIAGLLEVPVSCVNVKGKTHEKVDAAGEARAIIAHVAVLLMARR